MASGPSGVLNNSAFVSIFGLLGSFFSWDVSSVWLNISWRLSWLGLAVFFSVELFGTVWNEGLMDSSLPTVEIYCLEKQNCRSKDKQTDNEYIIS